MVTVRVLGEFIVEGASDLDAHTDAVMNELLALEGPTLSDSDISAKLSEKVVEISITSADLDFDSAVDRGRSAIRTAIHAAGGRTPDWNNVIYAPQKSEAELVSN
jgi:hypothetical protein